MRPVVMKSQLVQSSPIGAERATGNASAISSDLQAMIRRSFHNNGIGIEPAAQPRVFEMFHRLHSAATEIAK